MIGPWIHNKIIEGLALGVNQKGNWKIGVTAQIRHSPAAGSKFGEWLNLGLTYFVESGLHAGRSKEQRSSRNG
jgi:hypothetical protein